MDITTLTSYVTVISKSCHLLAVSNGKRKRATTLFCFIMDGFKSDYNSCHSSLVDLVSPESWHFLHNVIVFMESNRRLGARDGRKSIKRKREEGKISLPNLVLHTHAVPTEYWIRLTSGGHCIDESSVHEWVSLNLGQHRVPTSEHFSGKMRVCWVEFSSDFGLCRIVLERVFDFRASTGVRR